MNKNNAGFWAFLGVVAAIVIGAFFLAPNMFKNNPESASQPAPQTNMVDATANAPDAPSATAGEGQGLPADAANTESDAGAAADPAVAADSWITPSFDVLRVEPDGSTVIAGKAEPGTTLDIMNGETVIASTEVGSSGDFAVIFDNPLPAGDYQLTLRITGADGTVRLSEEVATVSIPETADGELLAMVSKPGKASRIIAQPAAPVTAEPVEMAAATPDVNDTETPAAMPDQPAAAGTDTGGGAPATTATETAAATETDAATEGKTEMAAAAVAPSPGVETPALPEASALLTTSAPQVAGQGDAANAADDTAASAADAAPAAEVALATPEAPAVEAMPADATVRVDAVEIEGDRIFIAGSATPGFKVQVAADGVVIGSDTADETGRFIVEATTELSVGDHIINADLMDEAGESILLRATVPFNRPEGEALAAVSPAEPATAAAQPESAPAQAESAAAAPASEAAADSMQSAAADTPGELILPDIASLSKMREDAFEALSQLKAMVSAPDAADAAAVSAALEQAVSKLRSAAMADLPAGSSSEAMAIARSMRIQAETALAVLTPKPDGQAAGGTAGSMVDDAARMSELLTQAETALAEPADMAGAAADAAEGVVAASGQSGEPKTILQAPLASTPGAVIIRRGDTLWQISRRTYGEGVRYTTIYVANRSQIQNPDRIKPGQVFSVPETPLENAEEMHKQLLGKGKKL